MTKLAWDNVVDRTFESGVDHGVLYPRGGAGVPWNGLKTVKEGHSGGTPVGYYVDGVKTRERSLPTEFILGIEAITYPDEFAECDGTVWNKGLGFGQQRHKHFGLSYRTKVGSALTDDLGYKLHLVYNALATPTERNNTSLSNSTDPLSFTWAVSTTPVIIPNRAPTAHLIIDSRKVSSQLLTIIESYLYGTDTTQPQMPSATDLANIFDTWSDYSGFNFVGFSTAAPVLMYNAAQNPYFSSLAGAQSDYRTNEVLDPNFAAGNPITANNATLHTIAKAITVNGVPTLNSTAARSTMTAGHVATPFLLSVYNVDGLGGVGSPSRYVGAWFYSSGAGYSGYFLHDNTNKVPLPTGTWVFIAPKVPVPAGVYVQALISKDTGNVTNDTDTAFLTGMTANLTYPVTETIWGTRQSGDDKSYAWVGIVNNSKSVQRVSDEYLTPGFNAAAFRSSVWTASPFYSVRISPMSPTLTENKTGAIVASTSGNYQPTYNLVPGKTYVVRATRRIAAPLTGTLDNNYAGRIVLTQTGPAGIPTTVPSTQQAPNTAGIVEVSGTFTVDPTATSAQIKLGHGGSFGSGDVWWDNFFITDTADYNGLTYFGDTGMFVYRNQEVYPGWVGQAPFSMSVAPFHAALPTVAAEGDLFITDGSLWRRESGTWKVKRALKL